MKALSMAALLPASCLLAASCSQAPKGNDRVFVSDEKADVLHVIDGATGEVEATLPTGRRPRGLALSPDGKVLYVAASDSDRIEAWDTHDLEKIRDIASGSDPERLVVSPTAGRSTRPTRTGARCRSSISPPAG